MERKSKINEGMKPEGLSAEARTAWWREQIRAKQASGMNRRRYCREKGVNLQGLTYWERKFRDEGQEPGLEELSAFPRFLPVKIGYESPGVGACLNAWVGEVRLEVNPGFDASLLREAVRALRDV